MLEPADEKPCPMFRVGTWNMDHWKRAVEQRRAGWSALHALGIQAALLQEAVVPASVDRTHVVSRPIAGTRPWGSAVVSLNDAPLWWTRRFESSRQESETTAAPDEHGRGDRGSWGRFRSGILMDR
jgi:hypothetical protein